MILIRVYSHIVTAKTLPQHTPRQATSRDPVENLPRAVSQWAVGYQSTVCYSSTESRDPSDLSPGLSRSFSCILNSPRNPVLLWPRPPSVSRRHLNRTKLRSLHIKGLAVTQTFRDLYDQEVRNHLQSDTLQAIQLIKQCNKGKHIMDWSTSSSWSPKTPTPGYILISRIDSIGNFRCV